MQTYEPQLRETWIQRFAKVITHCQEVFRAEFPYFLWLYLRDVEVVKRLNNSHGLEAALLRWGWELFLSGLSAICSEERRWVVVDGDYHIRFVI